MTLSIEHYERRHKINIDRQMPELVEVENYRRQMLPLVASAEKGNALSTITVDCPSETQPKSFPSLTDFDFIRKCSISKIEQKGKLIRLCLCLQNIDGDTDGDTNANTDANANDDKKTSQTKGHLYFHMGMTGRISTPNYVPNLESLSNNDSYPPPHTHLLLKANGYEVAFSDPRRFGAVCLNGKGTLENQWNGFAVDALDQNASFAGFLGRKKGIKGLLLDQRAVLSGVGN
jgi:formamidopyrimidine-DNA glycosylase